MTGKRRWLTGTLVISGLMLGSVGAAQARPRYDRGWGYPHRYHDGFGFGDAVGVAALVGAVAIVASSMSKDRQAARPTDGGYDGPPPVSGTDYGADMQGNVPRDQTRRDDADFSDVSGSAAQEDQMTDACALAARDEAQGREGGYAEVRHIDAPRATQDGYNIDGEVETRASYRATGGATRRFTCAMQNGRVAEVYLSRDVAAR